MVIFNDSVAHQLIFLWILHSYIMILTMLHNAHDSPMVNMNILLVDLVSVTLAVISWPENLRLPLNQVVSWLEACLESLSGDSALLKLSEVSVVRLFIYFMILTPMIIFTLPVVHIYGSSYDDY